MKEIILGAVIMGLGIGSVAALVTWWGRTSFRESLGGMRIYERNWPKILGWTLPMEQIDALEFAFAEAFKARGYDPVLLVKIFKSLSVFFGPKPMLDPRPKRLHSSGFVSGYHSGDFIWIGIQPRIWETALAHEVMHEYLERIHNDPDSDHLKAEWWESGLVGAVNAELKKQFPW